MLTKLFLLYSYEDIGKYNHPNIIPLKLDQTEYFESEAFRMLEEKDLPDCDNIAFISPKALERNIEKISLKQYMEGLDKYIHTIEPLHMFSLHHTLLDSIYAHGEKFLKIWTILSYRIGFINYRNHDIKMFYRNSWIAKRETVIGFLRFIKPLFKIMEEPELKELAFTDSGYNDGSLTREVLIAKLGVPYYTQHAFVFERLICLYRYMMEQGSGII